MTDWAAALAGACARNGVPGASLCIDRDGELVLATAGVRAADTAAPVTPDTIFRLGSISKLVTATLAMQSAEAGRLDLDAPVARLMPDLALGTPGVAEAITPRLFLCHRSGLFGDVLDGPSEGDDALAAYAAAAHRLLALTPPGAAFSYCNAGFALTGRLVEIAEGTTWDRLVAERVFAPLGMVRSGPLPFGHPDGDVARGHAVTAEDVQVLPVETTGRAMAPAGATAWTTARDLARFGAMLRDGGAGVLSPAAIAAMTVLATPGPTPTFATGWGLGVQRFTRDGSAFGHDGAVAGQNCFLRVVPSERLVFALMASGGDMRGLFVDLFGLVEAQAGRALIDPAPLWPEASLPVDAARYAGVYAAPRYTVRVTSAPEGLAARFEPGPDAGDFGAPIDVALRRQPDQDDDGLFLARFPGARLPTQQHFSQGPDGRRRLLFRGRLLPEVA